MADGGRVDASPLTPRHDSGPPDPGDPSDAGTADAGLNAVWDAELDAGTAEDAGHEQAEEVFTTVRSWESLRTTGVPGAGTVDAAWTAVGTLSAPNELRAAGAHQVPWGAGNMLVGDTFVSTLYEGSLGTARLRTAFRFQDGPGATNSTIKGAPMLFMGEHDSYRSGIPVFGTVAEGAGFWSDEPSELRARSVFRAIEDTSGKVLFAQQVYAHRTRHTGAIHDAFHYDIQVRLRSHRETFNPPVHGTFIMDGRTWNWRTRRIDQDEWSFFTWPTIEYDFGEVATVDWQFLLQSRALPALNAATGHADTRLWVRGIEAWLEPMFGTGTYDLDGLEVVYDGTTYGRVRNNP